MSQPALPYRDLPGARPRWMLEAAGAVLLAFSAALLWFDHPSNAVKDDGADPLWLVVDVSRSMRAGTPSRLDLARVGLEAWLDRAGTTLPRPTGLIVFAAHARMVVSPGTKTPLLRSQVSRLSTLALAADLSPVPGDPSGTDLSSGIALARSWPNRGSVWLLTDGDDPANRRVPDDSPKATRAWVIGAPGAKEAVPEVDPPATSSPQPRRVRELTLGEVVESGQSPPRLPELSPAILPPAQATGGMALALAGLAFMFASALPNRWLPAMVLGFAGCSGSPSADPAREGMAMLARARLLPAREQGPALRSTENTLRKALANSDNPDLLEALVICLMDQAPFDPRAPRLAAEIAIGLPHERGEPLRARARWLEALQATKGRPPEGNTPQGDAPGEGMGNDEGAPGASRRRELRPGASGGSETRDALPGAGRLPIVSDTTEPQQLTREEASRVIGVASGRLTPPSPARRSIPPAGVPDW